MTIRPLHVVANALPDQVGYTLRTHRLLQAQSSIGLDPICFVIPERRIIPYHVFEEPCIGIRTEDGIRYGRLTERRPFKRLAIQCSQWLQDHQVKGSWRFGTTFKPPENSLEAICEWASNQPRFDIVHAHTPAACAIIGRRLADEFRCPLVYEVRGFWELTDEVQATSQASKSQKLLAAAAREIEIAKSADAVITLGDTMRDELVRRGIARETIHVVGNGVDTSSYSPLTNKDPTLIEELALDGSFVIGCATNVRRLEGLSTVLKAMKLLNANRSVKFVLVGDGIDLPLLKAEASELGVSHLVRFVGRVPHTDVHRYYSLFDAFVLPRIDAEVCRIVTPLKPLEAMAMALPLIVSDLPALTELLDDGRTGISFLADDPIDLANETERLIADPSICKQMGQNGRKWATKHREWKPLAVKTGEIYERLLEKY